MGSTFSVQSLLHALAIDPQASEDCFPNDFEHNILLQVSLSRPLGPLAPFVIFAALKTSSASMFSKMTGSTKGNSPFLSAPGASGAASGCLVFSFSITSGLILRG